MTTTPTKQYDVSGMLLNRPFKIRRLSHFGLNSDHMAAVAYFYRAETDRVGWAIYP